MLLHSRIYGDGFPLVILHGFLGMGDNWKTLGKRLTQLGYQVHLVDQRNHGRSFHDDAFSYEHMVADLWSYFEHHNIEKAVLLGHSMGGKTAMLFAVDHPEMVSQLIIVDIGPKAYPPHHNDILSALTALDLHGVNSRKEADERLAKDITDYGLRLFLLKNLYWEQPGKLALRLNLPILAESGTSIGTALHDNARYNGPTLIVTGDKSDYIVPEDAALIMKHFPNARIETVKSAGHWVHAENPGGFYEVVSDFLPLMKISDENNS